MFLTKWKKWIGMVSIGLFCFVAGTMASSPIEKIEAYLRPDFTMKVDGKTHHTALPPLVYQDRTYLPLSELGEHFGADIVWEAKSKTIYLNTRISELQPMVEADFTHEEIEHMYAMGQIAHYLGRSYPVLTTMTMDGQTFYRMQDLERMGVDVKPLQKAKERLTGALYVSKSEAAKVWKEEPDWGYPYPQPFIVTGENDPAKIEALAAYEPVEWIQSYDGEGTLEMYPKGGVPIVIDRISSEANLYRMLYHVRNEFWEYDLGLSTREEEVFEDGTFVTKQSWFVSSVSNRNLSADK